MTGTSRRRLALLVVAAALVAVALLAGVLAPRWSDGEGGSYAPARLSTSARIEPGSALFGDVLTARATALVDTRAIDPDTVQLYPRFEPYRIASSARSVTDGVGRAARVEYVFRLHCLTAACLDAMEREGENGRRITTPISFASARLVAETRDGGEQEARVRWPSVVVRSRLSPEDIESGRPVLPKLRLPAASYRVSPDLLGWALVVVSAALALCGAWLLASVLRARVAVRRLLLPAHLTAVERALALARHAAASGDTAGERRALERLASELRRQGDRELALAARRLAWSKHEPTGEALEEFAGELARTGNGR